MPADDSKFENEWELLLRVDFILVRVGVWPASLMPYEDDNIDKDTYYTKNIKINYS